MNNTTEKSALSSGVQWGYIIIGLVSFLVTGLPNIGVLVLIAINRRLHSVSNYFLANLYVSNILLTTTFLVLCTFAGVSVDKKVEVAVVAVALLVGIGGYCMAATMMIGNRYYRVARPMRYMMLLYDARCALVIASGWALLCAIVLLWVLVTFLAINISEPADISASNTTTANLSESLDIELVEMCQSFVIFLDTLIIPSLVAMTCLGMGLFRIARGQARRIQEEERMQGSFRPQRPVEDGRVRADACSPGHEAPVHEARICEAPTCEAPDPAPKQGRVGRKSSAFIRVFIGSYVICWLPFMCSLNLAVFKDASFGSGTFSRRRLSLFIAPLMQVLFATLLLTFNQAEYKQAARSAGRALAKKLLCRSA